ncbi:MAG TPA: hypothetical protein ENJ97_08490 [Planctomycetes bacterium]|nr:hypothetical protein [Planctomycetota bacterium]
MENQDSGPREVPAGGPSLSPWAGLAWGWSFP